MKQTCWYYQYEKIDRQMNFATSNYVNVIGKEWFLPEKNFNYVSVPTGGFNNYYYFFKIEINL